MKGSNQAHGAGAILLTAGSHGPSATATGDPSRAPWGSAAQPGVRSRYHPGMVWKGHKGQLPSLPLLCRNPFLEMKDSSEAELGSGALEDGNWFPC